MGQKNSLIYYPSRKLRASTEEIKVFDEDLNQLIIDMFMVMKKFNGMGLAAPQIGRKESVIVYKVIDGREEVEGCLINPRIISKSDKKSKMTEQCLSFPGLTVAVERPESVTIEYQDPEGMKKTLDASDYLARCLQHEIDHLSGRLIVDSLSVIKRDVIKRKYKRFHKLIKSKITV